MVVALAVLVGFVAAKMPGEGLAERAFVAAGAIWMILAGLSLAHVAPSWSNALLPSA